MEEQAKKDVQELIERSRAAQQKIEFASQEEVDLLVLKLGWAGVKPGFAEKLAETLEEESGMGNSRDKFAKIQNKVRGALWDMKDQPTAGVVERNSELGIMKLAKPMGVIGAIIPVTNGEATPLVKALSAVKTRNSVIFAPHPKAQKTTRLIVDHLKSVLVQNGYPEDLIQSIDPVSLEGTQELMKQCDLILATGGAGLVKEAYSSGTPSQGVGAGNAVSVIDETCDIKEAAEKIKRSKTFDYATSCSTENSLVIEAGIYDKMLEALQQAGAYLVKGEEKVQLKEAMWKNGVLNRELVASAPEKIASYAGISLPKGKSFFVVEETGIGKEYPFSGEKLSVITAAYRWEQFEEAINLVNRITGFSGPGHSCGIHSSNEKRIRQLAVHVKVSRIMVNQPQCLANSGAWTNGMPMSLTLGCGSWGNNASSSNITWRHLLNYTWVSFPIPTREPNDEELFGLEIMKS